MFKQRAKRKFHVSTDRVFLLGKTSKLHGILRRFKPYTKRAVYRSSDSNLLAL